MAFYMTVLLTLVLLTTFWTLPVLSAVYKRGDDYIRNSTTEDFIKSAISPKLVNSSISDTVSIEIRNKVNDEARNNPQQELKSESRKKKPDMMTRILPMMIIPFMLQTAIIPMMLIMLKMMLIKSAFIGKMAILLGFLNMFRNNNNKGGVYTHDVTIEHPHDKMDETLAEGHYGYQGYDEYGPYVNRRKRSFR